MNYRTELIKFLEKHHRILCYNIILGPKDYLSDDALHMMEQKFCEFCELEITIENSRNEYFNGE